MKSVSGLWHKLSLRKKFLLTFITLMLLALLMLSLLASRLLEQEVNKAVESEMQSSLALTQSQAEQWLETKQLQLQVIAKHLDANPENLDEWKNLLTVGREGGGFNLLYIGTANGQFIQSNPPEKIPEGFDPRRRPWFIEAQKQQGIILTPIYPDALTGSLTATLAIPLLQDANQVLGADLYISTFIEDLLKDDLRWTSQVIMYDQNQTILAHADSDLLQLKLADQLTGFDVKQKATQEVTFQGKEWLAAATQVKDTNWNFLLLVDVNEIEAAHFDLLQKMLLLAIMVLSVGGAIVYWVTKNLTEPLQHFQRQLKHITSSLDLSQRLKTSDQAELGDLAIQTNSLLERIEIAISGVLGSSKRLTTTANHLAQTAGLVGRNTNKQQEVSQSMAAAVEQMSSSVAEITSTMEELSASSTQIADHSQSVVDVANLTLDSSKKGANAMQHLQSRMGDIHQDSAINLQEIIQLGSKSKEISKVMDLINTLADQTKLIAFNAALEASSAGESGKRFSVVASEIRRLADSVTDSTHEIEDRIQEIQDSISRLVITSEKSASSIQLGMQVSSETAEDLNALVQAASKTSNAAQQISLSTKQQKTASSQVVIALHDIANASSHNADSVRGITEVSEDMIEMSKQLNELVHEFKVKR